MRPLHNAKKNSASNQGTGQYDGKKRIDSALLPVLAFPFSRFPVSSCGCKCMGNLRVYTFIIIYNYNYIL